MTGENRNEHSSNLHHADHEGIRRKPLTLDEIKSNALVELGSPIVNIETTDGATDIIWENALDMYNRYLPVEKFEVLDGVTSTVNEYNLKELEKPFGRGVVSVGIGTKENFFSPIGGVFALGIPHPISHLSPDQYDNALRYIKTARKVYSSAPDFEWEEPILWLYNPTGFGGPFLAAYTYLGEAQCAEDIAGEDRSWIKEYYTALLKHSVGMARRKYGGIPGPAGQNLDGQLLVQEAREDKLRLEDDIYQRSLARVVPLSPGGYG